MYAVQTAMVDADSNGGADIEVVAAVTGAAIVIDYIAISSAAAVTDCFLETGASTVIFPKFAMAAGVPLVLPNVTLRGARGSNIALSATVTGTISIYVQYHLES
jgi:hypothetical protein